MDKFGTVALVPYCRRQFVLPTVPVHEIRILATILNTISCWWVGDQLKLEYLLVRCHICKELFIKCLHQIWSTMPALSTAAAEALAKLNHRHIWIRANPCIRPASLQSGSSSQSVVNSKAPPFSWWSVDDDHAIWNRQFSGSTTISHIGRSI